MLTAELERRKVSYMLFWVIIKGRQIYKSANYGTEILERKSTLSRGEHAFLRVSPLLGPWRAHWINPQWSRKRPGGESTVYTPLLKFFVANTGKYGESSLHAILCMKDGEWSALSKTSRQTP